mgnify:CR=1 FL=1
MSISDRIVVMKAGVVQQIGKPQEVYDDPVNLFVAKFLGTPPINVWKGEIRNEKLCIGDAVLLDAPGQKDRAVCGDPSGRLRAEGRRSSHLPSGRCGGHGKRYFDRIHA